MKTPPKSHWKTIDEYFEFTQDHGVFGAEANKLKEKMGKQIIPIPKRKKI